MSRHVEFLRTTNARRLVRETVGEILSDLSAVLKSGLYGGNQFAYDVTAVLVGPEEINYMQAVVDVGDDPQDYAQLVAELRARTIAQRMSLRAAARLAGSPVLHGLAVAAGMPLTQQGAISAKAGNALVYLSEPTASQAEEVALIVTCAGLNPLHNERYAEAMAALCKFALLGELASRTAAGSLANAA